MSRLRHLVLSDRFFFLTTRVLQTRTELGEADFELLARAFGAARIRHSFLLTAWVFLPDHWHAILHPSYPPTVSQVMKAVKLSSMLLINRRCRESGELWQGRFFDHALRTVREYTDTVEYIHLNPVRRGLATTPQDWRWSSVGEYSGVGADEQKQRCGQTVDRVSLPADRKARI